MATTHVQTHTDGRIATPCTAARARELTDRLLSELGTAHRTLLTIWEEKAWTGLGYSNWREYAQAELFMSQSHAYRLLDQGKVTAALEAASNFSPIGEITIEAAREIKTILPEVTDEVRARVAAGEPANTVVAEVVTAAREVAAAQKSKDNPKPRRKREPAEPKQTDAERIVELEERLAEMAGHLEDDMRRVTQLEAENASLRTDDAGTEIRKLHAVRAQEHANNLGLQREVSALKEGIRKRDSLFNRIRKELGIDRDGDILATIASLRS